MRRVNRSMVWPLVVLMLGCLLFGYQAAVSSHEALKTSLACKSKEKCQAGHQKKLLGIISPPDHAILLSGNLDVIYKSDKACKSGETALDINGRSYKWESFQPPLQVAHVRLAPGFYELNVGDQRREFVVALNEDEHDGPEDWNHFRQHKMDVGHQRCGDCHETTEKEDQIAVGQLKPDKACFTCHTQGEFDDAHSEPLKPDQHCHTCHALHGSHRKGLLKAPVEELR